MNTNYNRVLFDYDGTILLHTKTDEGRDIAGVLGIFDDERVEIFGREIMHFFLTQNNYYTNIKVNYGIYFDVMDYLMPCIKAFGLTPKQVDDAINEKTKTLSVLADNIVETLEYLNVQGYKLCVFTNGFYQTQAANMKHHGIFDYFEQLFAWDNFYPKPDQRFMKRALAGTDPKTNVMVGDNIVSDISMAKKAGVLAIGYNTEDTIDMYTKPDIVIQDMLTLKKIL